MQKNKILDLGDSIINHYNAKEDRILKMKERIRNLVEEIINKDKGRIPKSKEEGQGAAQIINQIASDHGLRVENPKTGGPGTLQFKRVGNALKEIFVITQGKKSCYMGQALPEIKLVAEKDHKSRPLASALKKKTPPN